MRGLAWFFALSVVAACDGSDATGRSSRVDAGGGSFADQPPDASSGLPPNQNGSGGGSIGGTNSPSNDCTGLTATVRDFKDDHPDFERFSGGDAYEGLVKSTLGPNNKPEHAATSATAQTAGPDAFKTWYQDVPNTNMAVAIDIALVDQGGGRFVYDNQAFFPLDGKGFGNQGRNHNFHFTTEIHTNFSYRGGEVFTFTGDDDLWLFINGKLAVDLGGVHPKKSRTIMLDQKAAELGIAPGNTYRMDIFHAERHTTESTFRIETTIDCFKPVVI